MGFIDSIKSLLGMNGGQKKSSGPAKSISGSRKHEGTVTYFNHKKGFGFITARDMDKQVFLHISEIPSKPRKGMNVTFEIQPDPKGDRAVNVAEAN